MPIEDDDVWATRVTDTATDSGPTDPTPPARGSGTPSRTLLGIGGLVAGIVVIAVVAIVVLGGSSGISKAAWIQKADALCGKTFPQQASDVSKDNLTGAASLAQQTLTKIRALGLPSSGASVVKKIESEEQNGTNLMEQAAEEESANPTQAETDLQHASTVITSAQKQAGAFGMQVCNAGQH